MTNLTWATGYRPYIGLAYKSILYNFSLRDMRYINAEECLEMIEIICKLGELGTEEYQKRYMKELKELINEFEKDEN